MFGLLQLCIFPTLLIESIDWLKILSNWKHWFIESFTLVKFFWKFCFIKSLFESFVLLKVCLKVLVLRAYLIERFLALKALFCSKVLTGSLARICTFVYKCFERKKKKFENCLLSFCSYWRERKIGKYIFYSIR